MDIEDSRRYRSRHINNDLKSGSRSLNSCLCLSRLNLKLPFHYNVFDLYDPTLVTLSIDDP